MRTPATSPLARMASPKQAPAANAARRESFSYQTSPSSRAALKVAANGRSVTPIWL